MSMQSIEREMMIELREVAKNPKLKLKQVMEWSTGEVKAQEGETFYRLPKLGLNVAVKLELPKAKKAE